MQHLKYIHRLMAAALSFAFFMTGCATHKLEVQWTPLDASAFSNPLTLEQCLDLAEKNDIRTAQWKARLQTAHAGLTEARALPNPTLALTWDDIGLKDEAGVSVSSLTYGVTYPIMFWWSRGLKIKAAKINQESEAAAVASEKRQLAIDMASAYFNLVADQRRVALEENIAKDAGEQYRLAVEQGSLNDISAFAVEQARLDMAKAESDFKETQHQLRTDQLSFAFALGADHPVYPAVVDCGDDYLQPEGVSAQDETLSEGALKAAVEKDPDYVQKKLAADYAAAKLGIEKENSIPLADTVASGGPKVSDEGNSSAYSLEVPIPLLDWNKAGRENAHAQLLTSMADEEQARRDAVSKITSSYESYRALAWKWTQYASGASEQAEKNSKSNIRLYEMGRISYGEMLQSQRDLISVRLEAVDTWQQLSTAAWELGIMMGNL